MYIIAIRAATRNRANKVASKWIKSEKPHLVGKCNFEIYVFTEVQDETIVHIQDIPLM